MAVHESSHVGQGAGAVLVLAGLGFTAWGVRRVRELRQLDPSARAAGLLGLGLLCPGTCLVLKDYSKDPNWLERQADIGLHNGADVVQLRKKHGDDLVFDALQQKDMLDLSTFVYDWDPKYVSKLTDQQRTYLLDHVAKGLVDLELIHLYGSGYDWVLDANKIAVLQQLNCRDRLRADLESVLETLPVAYNVDYRVLLQLLSKNLPMLEISVKANHLLIEHCRNKSTDPRKEFTLAYLEEDHFWYHCSGPLHAAFQCGGTPADAIDEMQLAPQRVQEIIAVRFKSIQVADFRNLAVQIRNNSQLCDQIPLDQKEVLMTLMDAWIEKQNAGIVTAKDAVGIFQSSELDAAVQRALDKFVTH